MIDLRESDIVATRRTVGGRFVIFTRTDVCPRWLLPWWGAVLDTGGDGYGILARLENAAAPDGWTFRQLLTVVVAHARAEQARLPRLEADTALPHLRAATVLAGACADELPLRLPTPIGGLFSPDGGVRCGEFRLNLCPDPGCVREGIAAEQLLIVLDQMLVNAVGKSAAPHWVIDASQHIAAALAAEAARAASHRRR